MEYGLEREHAGRRRADAAGGALHDCRFISSAGLRAVLWLPRMPTSAAGTFLGGGKTFSSAL